MTKKIFAVAMATLIAASPFLCLAETEVRLIGGPGENNAGDMYLAPSGYIDSAGGRRIYAINLNTFGFPQDNSIKGGNANLYGMSYGVVSPWRMPYFGTGGAVSMLGLGQSGYCLKSSGTASPPTWGTCGTSTGSTDNADNIIYGTLAMARGGWGDDVSAAVGIPYLDNGSVSFDTLTQFFARAGITYNPSDNSWVFSGKITSSREIIAPSFASTAPDGYHRINLANSSAPTDNVIVGDCYYDNSSLLWLCWNGSSWAGAGGDVTASSETTFTNKTYDPAGTGNVFTHYTQEDFTILNPVAADNSMLFKAQYAMTVSAIHCIAEGGGTITLQILECSSTGTSCAGLDGSTTITCDSDGATDDGSLSNPSIDAGDWVKVLYGAPSGTVNTLTYSIYYSESQ